MAFIGRIFGGGGNNQNKQKQSSSSAADQTLAALQSLQEKEELLEKRKEYIEKQVDQEVSKAKEFLKNQKKGQAETCLQRKKMYEQQLKQVSTSILRLSEQRVTLEGARSTAEALSVMKEAAAAQKLQMKEVNIDNVDMLLEEIQESNDELKQLNHAMAQPLGMGADMDEDDIANELSELEGQITEEQFAKHDVIASQLPSAQKTKPQQQKQDISVEDELAALEQDLNRPVPAQ